MKSTSKEYFNAFKAQETQFILVSAIKYFLLRLDKLNILIKNKKEVQIISVQGSVKFINVNVIFFMKKNNFLANSLY